MQKKYKRLKRGCNFFWWFTFCGGHVLNDGDDGGEPCGDSLRHFLERINSLCERCDEVHHNLLIFLLIFGKTNYKISVKAFMAVGVVRWKFRSECLLTHEIEDFCSDIRLPPNKGTERSYMFTVSSARDRRDQSVLAVLCSIR